MDLCGVPPLSAEGAPGLIPEHLRGTRMFRSSPRHGEKSVPLPLQVLLCRQINTLRPESEPRHDPKDGSSSPVRFCFLSVLERRFLKVALSQSQEVKQESSDSAEQRQEEGNQSGLKPATSSRPAAPQPWGGGILSNVNPHKDFQTFITNLFHF